MLTHLTFSSEKLKRSSTSCIKSGQYIFTSFKQLAFNFCLRNTTLPLCRKCTVFFSSCVFHIFCEQFERCLTALIIMQSPTRQSFSKFYLREKKNTPRFPACVSSEQCTPSPKSVPGSEANPRSLCQQKSQSLICAHLWNHVPPLRGPGLTQASLPALRLHLQQVPRPRANQRLPQWKKIKVILSGAEPWRTGDKQGKRAARLSQVS